MNLLLFILEQKNKIWNNNNAKSKMKNAKLRRGLFPQFQLIVAKRRLNF